MALDQKTGRISCRLKNFEEAAAAHRTKLANSLRSSASCGIRLFACPVRFVCCIDRVGHFVDDTPYGSFELYG